MAPKLGLDPGQPYEYDDEQTYEEAVAASVEAQYEPVQPPSLAPAPSGSIGITEFDQGPAQVTYTPDSEYVAPVQPASTYFDEPAPVEPTTGMGFTDMGPVVQPYVPGSAYFDEPQQPEPIRDEDWFTADNQQALFDQGVNDIVGPPPVLGQGSGLYGESASQWFSSDPAAVEQQRQWWDSEVNRAIQNGDWEKYDALQTEMAQVQGAYAAYDAERMGYQYKFNDYTQRFNANLEASLSPDLRGEGGFVRDDAGNLISTLDQQGYIDQIGTPKIINPFTGDPQTMTDFQREYAIRNALYEQDAQQAGNFPDRVVMQPGQTFEQYVAERQRAFRGDPDAQAWFGGFGAGAYGPAPDQPLPFKIADRAPNLNLNPFASDEAQPGQQVVRNQSVTPASLIGGALDLAGRGVGKVWDGTKWVATTDAPGTDTSLWDALGALSITGEASFGATKYTVASAIHGIRTSGQAISDLLQTGNFHPSMDPNKPTIAENTRTVVERIQDEQTVNTIQGMVNRWEQNHPYANMLGEVVIDPLNFIPVGLVGKGIQLGKLRTVNVLLRDVLTTDEMARLAERGVTMRDLYRIGRSEATVNKFLTGQGLVTLDRTKLAQAFSRRVIYRAEIEVGRGGDIGRILAEERQRLPELAQRIGASDADVNWLRPLAERHERQIAETLALGPGDVMVGYPSISAANKGFHEVWEPVWKNGGDLERTADDIPSARLIEETPGPIPPSTIQKEMAQEFFDNGALSASDYRRIMNDEITDREAYPIIGAAMQESHAHGTSLQFHLAWNLVDEGKMTLGEMSRIVNRKASRDQVKKIIDHARFRKPGELADFGIVRIPKTHPNYRRAVDAGWQERGWREASSKYLDNLMPSVEPHPSPKIGKAGWMRMGDAETARTVRFGKAATDTAPVAPAGLVIQTLQREIANGTFRGTKWETLLRPLESFRPFVRLDGSLSSTTVNAYWQHVRDSIVEAVRFGDMPKDDVTLMNRIVRDLYGGSKSEDAARAAEAAQTLQNAGRRSEKVLKDIADLKADNERLRGLLDAATQAGDDAEAKRLRGLMKTNTGRIRKIEPDYQSPRAPRKTGAQKAAEQDANLKANGAERPPTSDPSDGFVDPKNDAGNDILGRIIDGDNLGIVPPGTSWFYDWTKTGKKIIDPHADWLRRVDWEDADLGAAFDRHIRSMYEPESGWRKWVHDATAWGELQTGAKVAKTGDMGSLVINQLLDEWNAFVKEGDPAHFVADRLDLIANPKTGEDGLRSINPFFTNSREGGEMVKAFRFKTADGQTIGQKLAKELRNGTYDTQPSIGWFNDLLNIVGDEKGYVLTKTDLKKIDDLMRRSRPGGMDPIRWRRTQDLQAVARGRWDDLKRTRFNRNGKLEWGEVTVDDLNDLIMPRDTLAPRDLHAQAEKMGGRLGELYAEAVGYDWTKTDIFMKIMMSVKGNLAPLWMTMVPGYHLRNILGNIFAQMIGGLRSDMHVSPLLRTDDLWKRVVKEEGGIQHPWLEENLTGGHAADLATAVDPTTGKSRYVIPKALESKVVQKTPLGWWYTKSRNFANTSENFSKRVVYSQEWGYSYTDMWRKRLDAVDLSDDARKALLDKATFSELQVALKELGIDGAKRAQVIAANKEAKAFANIKAYQTASEVLRDYRMRNRLDFILDRIIPVHYWTTRNAMFVTRSLIDRPQTAVQGMAAFDAWEQQHQDLPPSMRWGLLPIPGNLLSWIPGSGVDANDTFYLRAGTFVNPAVFAIPKLLDPEKWDLSKTSLPDRLDAFGAVGLKNMWEAMGYDIGPQWDLILDQWGARGDGADAAFARWFASPSDYYQQVERRSISDDPLGRSYKDWLSRFDGYGPDGLPFIGSAGPFSEGNVSSFVRWVTQGKVDLNPLLEKANQTVYGSPYTRMETARIAMGAADQWQAGQISEDQYWAIMWAVGQRNFDPGADDVQEFLRLANKPDLKASEVEEAFARLRPLINGVTDASASGYLLSALGIGGKVDTPEAKGKRKAQDQWGDMREWDKEQVNDFLKMQGAQEEYRDIYYRDGRAVANAWMRENAPWLPGYWLAYDGETAYLDALDYWRGNNVEANADAAALALYEGRDEQRYAAAPYYERIDKINAAYDANRVKANGNLQLIDAYDRVRSDGIAAVYDQAAKDGVEMVGLGRLPRHARSFYDRPLSESRFLEQNMATEDVAQHELAQEQRGHILDLVAEQLDVQRYVTGKDGKRSLNPRFGGEDEWDEDAYQQALKDAAEQAPGIYRDLAMRYRDFRKAGFDTGILVEAMLPISAADFQFHMGDKDPELAAWRDEKGKAFERVMAMPQETSDERQQFYDAMTAFKAEWGDFPLGRDQARGPSGRTYKATEDYTAVQNAAYGEKVTSVNDWYYNQLTPRQRDDLKEQYPDAFTEVEKTSSSGNTYTGTDFDPKRLTGDQLAEIMFRYNVPASGVDEPFIVGKGGSSETPEAPGNKAANEARVEHLFMLSGAFDAVLNEEEKALIDAKFAVQDNPRWPEAEAALDSAITKKGFKSWKLAQVNAEKAGDQELADLIGAHLAARDNAKPAEQKQIDWFNSLTDGEKRLLAEEYPSKFDWLATKAGYSTGGSDASSSSVPAAESGGESSGPSGGGNSSNWLPYDEWIKTQPWYDGGRSSGGSSGSSRRSSGGGSSRSSGGGFRIGSTDEPLADQFSQSLFALDPFLAEGNDDGRAEVVQQISARFARMFPAFAFMNPRLAEMMQGLLLRWVAAKLGNSPTIESWNAILAWLSRNDQPAPPEEQATPLRESPAEPDNAALLAGY